MKRTYQPSKLRRKRATGFRARMKTTGGQKGSRASSLQGPQEDRSVADAGTRSRAVGPPCSPRIAVFDLALSCACAASRSSTRSTLPGAVSTIASSDCASNPTARASAHRPCRGRENRRQRRGAQSTAPPGARVLPPGPARAARGRHRGGGKISRRRGTSRQRCVLASPPFGNASPAHALRPETSDSRVPARHQPVARAALPFLSVVLALRAWKPSTRTARCAAAG